MVVVRRGERTISGAEGGGRVSGFRAVGGWEGRGRTECRMQDFENSERLGPFGVLADASVDVLVAGEREEEQHAPKEDGPEEGAGGVVGDEVSLLQRGARGWGTVHGGNEESAMLEGLMPLSMHRNC